MVDSEDEKGSGDVGSEQKPEEYQEPEVSKVPDVELIVDGFGFMPKTPVVTSKSRASNIYSKKNVEDEIMPEDGPKSPCGSSTNIDIVRRYTWKTKNRMIVQVITYGATITSIQVPDKKGVPDDVVAGFDTLQEYFQPRNPYFGATIGRYANIIRDGTIVVRPSGRMYMLSTNKGHDHYNGGYVGFDKVNWRSYVNGNKVIMSHVSDRFHEGYPGTVMAQVTFEVTCENTIKIEMRCTSSEPTIVNLSNSPYFNLAGHHAGCETMYDHIFTINADKYTVVDDDQIVTGEKKVVGGSAYDFRVPRVLRAMLPKIPLGGYDINYCVTQGTDQDLAFQARVLHPVSGRVLELYSNQPGMQFYTGNLLPDPDKIIESTSVAEQHEGKAEDESEESDSEESSAKGEESEEDGSEGKPRYGYVPLMGKSGTYYKKHGLFCLMPQNYPDAVNHKNFPNSVLNPGEVYVHRIQYKFGILLGRYV
ncbi:galactose mutarotase-like isoform X1 [Achroia grisella]|uniref:galactose mutarotase-like isoform X1 n=1 Tax=Achroia grisella TaxID=688607 RepID=UPI0027D33CA9|nr:galactose mutarotase-like isoform X1 [Achroia grisella]